MRELLTSVTRKGQITLPIEIRRALGIRQGDKVAVSLAVIVEGEDPRVILKPLRSVAEMTFGAVTARQHPEDFAALRRAFEEGLAVQVVLEPAAE